MSVLAISGTDIPDPTHRTRAVALDYSRSGGAVRDLSLSSRPAPQTYNYNRPDQTAYTLSTKPVHQTPSNPPKHSHSRTISSTAIPSPLLSGISQTPARGTPQSTHSRKSSTASYNMSNMSNMSMQRQPTGSSVNSSFPRRSTSGRSTATNGPSSYVALMRKQKATVWCERTQYVDSRQQAQQRAAKQRAHLAVKGSLNSASAGRIPPASSGGVVGKIRHGGVPKAPGYVPANMSGAGVPMRLSANEMLGDEEEERSLISGDNSMVHGRSGSGKSSINSAKYRSGYPRPDAARFSTSSTPPTAESSPSAADRIPEETPNGTEAAAKTEYFASRERPPSTEEDSFGELKDLAGPSAMDTAAAQAKKAEDLRRRGSVDERTMSLGSGVKLFVANPDVDSD